MRRFTLHDKTGDIGSGMEFSTGEVALRSTSTDEPGTRLYGSLDEVKMPKGVKVTWLDDKHQAVDDEPRVLAGIRGTVDAAE